jgi:hypothetical protein
LTLPQRNLHHEKTFTNSTILPSVNNIEHQSHALEFSHNIFGQGKSQNVRDPEEKGKSISSFTRKRDDADFTANPGYGTSLLDDLDIHHKSPIARLLVPWTIHD